MNCFSIGKDIIAITSLIMILPNDYMFVKMESFGKVEKKIVPALQPVFRYNYVKAIAGGVIIGLGGTV